MRKFISISIFALLVFALVSCKSNTSNNGDSVTEEFSWFGTVANDLNYYDSMDDNPVMQYLNLLSFNTNDEGQDVHLSFDFQTPVSGQELSTSVTMISTGTYTDVMSMSSYKQAGSVLDLYEQGIALDLTYYVENYMPNYLAFLDSHPDYARTASVNIDGEKKYIELYSYQENFVAWCGWQYRRDWIVEYADNVYGGTPFTSWTDTDGYHDDVVFPSGGSDPIYISDWEWMFEIFKYAREDLEISGGHVMSLYYPGYIRTGDLVASFGGGNPMYYQEDGVVQAGMTSDNFRTYLQAMNTWYANGWIDTHFAERTSDAFYQTAINDIFMGKVGLWIGSAPTLEDGIQNGLPNSPENGYTEGAMVFGARQPINDVYGSEEQQNIVPYTFYQPTLEGTSIIITEAAKDKDLVALCSLLDYMFSEEGKILFQYGLSKEQYELTQNDFMTEYGFTNGAWEWIEESDGEMNIKMVDGVDPGSDLEGALKAGRFFGLGTREYEHSVYSATETHSREEWEVYTQTGNFLDSLIGQMSPDDAETYSKLFSQINSFLERNVPALINGEKDPYDDDDWNAFVNAINKYNPSTGTEILQELLERFSVD